MCPEAAAVPSDQRTSHHCATAFDEGQAKGNMRTSSTNGANVHTSDSWIAKQVGSSGGDARHAYEALQGKPNVEVVVQYCGDEAMPLGLRT